MKVAANGCYGGFGLSPRATHEIAKRKGIDLVWYKEEGYRPTVYTRLDDVPTSNSYGPQAFTEDFGDVAEGYPKGSYYYPDYDRTDLDLIAVIEELGEEANGMCAELYIEEIPDGAEWEIDEYDGIESIVPPRQSW